MSNKYLDIAIEKIVSQEVNKVLEQIRAELVEDYESYSASEVNFDFACGIKRAMIRLIII